MNLFNKSETPYAAKEDVAPELVSKLKSKARVSGALFLSCIIPALYLVFSTIFFGDSGAEPSFFIQLFIINLWIGPFTLGICGLLLFLVSFSTEIEKRKLDIKICSRIPITQLLLAALFFALDGLVSLWGSYLLSSY